MPVIPLSFETHFQHIAIISHLLALTGFVHTVKWTPPAFRLLVCCRASRRNSQFKTLRPIYTLCAEEPELSGCDALGLYNRTWLPLTIILTDWTLIKKETLLSPGRNAWGSESLWCERSHSSCFHRDSISGFPLMLFSFFLLYLSLCLLRIWKMCVTQLASVMAGRAEITEPHCTCVSP